MLTETFRNITHRKGRWFRDERPTGDEFARCRCCDSVWHRPRTDRGRSWSQSAGSRRRPSRPSDPAAAADEAGDDADDAREVADDNTAMCSSAARRRATSQPSTVRRRPSTARAAPAEESSADPSSWFADPLSSSAVPTFTPGTTSVRTSPRYVQSLCNGPTPANNVTSICEQRKCNRLQRWGCSVVDSGQSAKMLAIYQSVGASRMSSGHASLTPSSRVTAAAAAAVGVAYRVSARPTTFVSRVNEQIWTRQNYWLRAATFYDVGGDRRKRRLCHQLAHWFYTQQCRQQPTNAPMFSQRNLMFEWNWH